MAHILVVDDDEPIARLFTRILEMDGHTVQSVGSIAETLEALDTATYEVVLLDVHLPDGRGDQIIPELLSRDPYLHVIAVSGDLKMDTVVSAKNLGAFYYYTKPFTPDTLTHVVRLALQSRADVVARAAEARRLIRSPKRLIGTSPQICAVNLMIDRVAKYSSTPVLITGESGTGKEMAAQIVHEVSARSSKPFIKVNCSAIPRPLIEAELFGHERGAFTDAKEMRKGLFELADGGTIFLDEIGDLDISMQPKLLRVLEDQQIWRVGANKPRQLDIRVVAATNRDLQAMCHTGDFREDLYFRLAVMHVHMPPLRDHPEDIEALAHLFLHEKSIELGKNVYSFSPTVLDFFRQYWWPGNVRELRNMVERLIILASTDTIELDAESLRRYCFAHSGGPDPLRQAGVSSSSGVSTPTAPQGPFAPRYDTARNNQPVPAAGSPPPTLLPNPWELMEVLPLEDVEKAYIVRTLSLLNGNKTICAKRLGISRSTLQRKLQAYGIIDESDVITQIPD